MAALLQAALLLLVGCSSGVEAKPNCKSCEKTYVQEYSDFKKLGGRRDFFCSPAAISCYDSCPHLVYELLDMACKDWTGYTQFVNNCEDTKDVVPKIRECSFSAVPAQNAGRCQYLFNLNECMSKVYKEECSGEGSEFGVKYMSKALEFHYIDNPQCQ